MVGSEIQAAGRSEFEYGWRTGDHMVLFVIFRVPVLPFRSNIAGPLRLV